MHECDAQALDDDRVNGQGPRQGSGASKAAFEWAGIEGRGRFPPEVKQGIGAPHDAKAYQYADGKMVIHVVGPDLADGNRTNNEVRVSLAKVYSNIFKELV